MSVSSSNYRRLSKPGRMAPEYQIRSQNDSIFYVENEIDRSIVIEVSLTSKTQKVK